MRQQFNIVEAMDSPKLFQKSFAGESWNPWRVVLKAAYALPMTNAEREFFQSIAGGRDPPTKKVRELWVVGGRRGGKDSVSSLIMAHTAALFSKGGRLRGGEIPLCVALACDRDQAKIILNYTKSYFAEIPALKKLVRRETAAGLELTNGVEVATGTNSYRAVRGRPILCAVLDEAAFYRTEESALPDEETYKALIPGMLTMQPDCMLVGISTPYRKSGLLYRKYQEHFGKNSDDVLVIQASSRTLNPMISQKAIDAAMEEDQAHALAEWYAVFRDDVSGWATREDIENAVDRDIVVRPPQPNIQYFSFVDGNGGRNDSFCAAVAHLENNIAVLDCLMEIRAGFGVKYDPDSAVPRIASMLKEYRCFSTTGDHYGAEWIVGSFKRNGIDYRSTDRNKSKIYCDALPLFTTGRARLLDNKRLVNQLCSLERKTTASGDKVDHGPGGHDDCANVACGALVLASVVKEQEVFPPPIVVSGGPRNIPGGTTFTSISQNYPTAQPAPNDAAAAAKQRAMAPSVPPTPSDPHRELSTTEKFLLWGGGGRGW